MYFSSQRLSSMKLTLILSVLVMVTYQNEADSENYTSYALMYPEIAKKIGEEPVEIIDVIKSVRVYDSDDEKSSPQSEAAGKAEPLDNTTIPKKPPSPDRIESVILDLTNSTTNSTLMDSTNATNSSMD